MKSQWKQITQKIELTDKDMDVSIGFYAKGSVDFAKMQIEGNLIPISDREILRRMFVRRVLQPYRSMIYRALLFLRKENL